MTTMEELPSRRTKVVLLPRLWERRIQPASCRIMGMFNTHKGTLARQSRSLTDSSIRLITCGTTVDEAAFLFYNLDQSCRAQLLAEAAAANGIKKKVIPHDVAQYTAQGMQSPVGHNLHSERSSI